MTLTSPAKASVDTIKARRLAALRVDLKIAYKECGPRFLTPHPTFGERFFVIADESTVLDKDMCSKHGEIHRSALMETISDVELDDLIRVLVKEGYHIKKCEKSVSTIDGSWIMFRTVYYGGDSR